MPNTGRKYLCLIQVFEVDFLWKVSLKILNLRIMLKHSPIMLYSVDPDEMLFTCSCKNVTFETLMKAEKLQNLELTNPKLSICSIC